MLRPALVCSRLVCRWILAVSPLVLAACAQAPAAAPTGVRDVWVQRSADALWSVRAITDAAECPTMNWADGAQRMHTRAAPGVEPPRGSAGQPQVKAAIFPVRSCEAPFPAGAERVLVDGIERRAPRDEMHRIVLVGDTGCRMKASENAFQDCNDPARWPFAAVARAAAERQPDLVVHLGDIHYRESPCPGGRAGCAGSPWGYGYDAWEADLFRPAAPLLAAAPWVITRGNHESCSRAGAGWFRFLDSRGLDTQANCADPAHDAQSDYTEPFAVALDNQTQIIVFDSAAVAGSAYRADDPALHIYRRQLEQVDRLAALKPHNFFLNHHPVLAFAGSANGQPKPGHAGLQSALAQAYPQRLFPAGVDLVLNGHVHLFEALGFASNHPATIVGGNSGSAMEGIVDPAALGRAQPAPGAQLQTFVTQPGFGFAELERDAEGWRLTEFGVNGQPLQRCTLRIQRLQCSTAP